jgi:hypothetical protein
MGDHGVHIFARSADFRDRVLTDLGQAYGDGQVKASSGPASASEPP